MSWSASGRITHLKSYDAPEIVMEREQAQTGNGAAESVDALAQAKDVAVALVKSGRLGYGDFTISLSGHANEGNKPVPGWSNDFLSITINQQSPRTA